MGIENETLHAIADLSDDEAAKTAEDTAARLLHGMDPDAHIRTTGFFNHSFAPDLVLGWDGSKDERYVYLRLTRDPGWLLEDARDLGRYSPIFVTISDRADPVPTSAGHRPTPLESTCIESNTLIDSLTSIEHMGSRDIGHPIAGLVSKLTTKGGRGDMQSVDTADRTVSVFENGLKQARKASKKLGDSIDVLERSFAPKAADRISGFFQALWKHATGHLSDYPRTVDTSGELDTDTWNYLLSLGEIGDLDFWASLGTGMTLDQVEQLDPSGHEANFDHLLTAQAPNLCIKSMAALRRQRAMGERSTGDTWTWGLHDTDSGRRLELSNDSFLVLFSGTSSLPVGKLKDSENLAAANGENGLSIDAFKKRASGHHVGEIRATTGENVTISGIRNEDAGRSTTLGELKGTTRIEGASVQLDSGPSVKVDFTTSTARTTTRSHPPLEETVRTVLPVLADLSEGQLDALDDKFHRPAGNDRQADGQAVQGELFEA